MLFRPGERRQSETSAITMRPGWLAQAAFVFAPSIPKGCPILPRTLRKGGIPRSRPSWASADTPQISMSHLILGCTGFWVAQRFSGILRGCPILPRTLRKGGIPRSRPSWASADTPQISMSHLILGCTGFWVAQRFSGILRGCPILPRTLRKGGIPRSRPSWALTDTPQISMSHLILAPLDFGWRSASAAFAFLALSTNGTGTRSLAQGAPLIRIRCE
jgi:hypothetical protein